MYVIFEIFLNGVWKNLYFQPNFCKESTKLSSTNPDKIGIESYVLLHFLKYFVPCILEILSFFEVVSNFLKYDEMTPKSGLQIEKQWGFTGILSAT